MMSPYKFEVLSKVLVPEDSVRPETQTLVTIIRRKGFVGSLEDLFYISLFNIIIK